MGVSEIKEVKEGENRNIGYKNKSTIHNSKFLCFFHFPKRSGYRSLKHTGIIKEQEEEDQEQEAKHHDVVLATDSGHPPTSNPIDKSL